MRVIPLPEKQNLNGIGLFRNLSHEELATISAQLQYREFRQNDVILAARQHSRALFFVHEGFVKICGDTTSHCEDKPLGRPVALNVAGPGTTLGLVHAIDNGGHSATAIALGTTRCFMLPTEGFLACRTKMPQLRDNICHELTALIRRQTCRYRAALLHNLHGRLAWVLLDFAYRFGVPQDDENRLIPFPVSNILLGELTYNTRGVVGDTLHFFAKHQAISIAARHRIIVNTCTLTKYCNYPPEPS